MGALRLRSGALTSTGKDAAELLLESHFPGCQPAEETTADQSYPDLPTTKDWEIASEVVTPDTVRWAINGFGSYKSA